MTMAQCRPPAILIVLAAEPVVPLPRSTTPSVEMEIVPEQV